MSDRTTRYPDTAPQQWAHPPAHVPSPNVQATMHQMTEQLRTVIDAAERAAEAIRYDAEDQARHHLAEAQRKADRLTAERVGLISDLTDDLIRHAATVRDHSEQMVRALEEAISSVTDKLDQPGLTDPFPPYSPGESYPDAAAPQPTLGSTASQPTTFGAYEAVSSEYQPAPSVPSPGPADELAPPLDGQAADADDVAAPSGGEGAPPDERRDAPTDIRSGWQRPSAPSESSVESAEGASSSIPEDALIHATRLAVAGEDHDTIAAALRNEYGVTDPGPVVRRVLGNPSL